MKKNKNDIIKQMQDILTPTNQENFNDEIDVAIEQNYAWIPELKEDEFLLSIFDCEESKVLTCAKELDWYTTQEIKVKAYRKSNLTENKVYYAGEYERREILSNAIIWIADVNTQQIIFNRDKQLLSHISSTAIDILWNMYIPIIKISATEANTIYNAALRYFHG